MSESVMFPPGMNNFTYEELAGFLCEAIEKRHKWWTEARSDTKDNRRNANNQQRLGLEVALGYALALRSNRVYPGSTPPSELELISMANEYYAWWKDQRR